MKFKRGLVLLALICWQPVMAAESEVDPWEGFNRKVFEFNDFLDRNLLLPVTETYVDVTPRLVQTGVTNFFGNLQDVVSMFSNLLQLKFHNTAQDFSRVVANTFFGIGGLIDVATPLGVAKQQEEFGQVLGYWGVPSGPYLVLPLLGPSNVRDGFSIIPNFELHPMSAMEQDRVYWGLKALETVDTRAGLMKAEQLVTGDRYSFIRDAYLQRRAFLVNDGELQDDLGDDGFGDDGF